MSTRVDVEAIEVTRGERLLGFVLASFLLVGGLWGYFELNLADDERAFREPTAELSAPQRATLERRAVADNRAAAAQQRVRDRRQALVDRREAYRTALDEGRRDPALARGTGRRSASRGRAITDRARGGRGGRGRATPRRAPHGGVAPGTRARATGRGAVADGLAAAPAVALGARRLRQRRCGRRLGSRHGRRLLDRLVRPRRPRPARARDSGCGFHARGTRRAPAPPRAPASRSARPARRVSVLRLPRRPGRALRGLRARGRRAVCPVRGAATGGHRALRRLRTGLTTVAAHRRPRSFVTDLPRWSPGDARARARV